MESPVKGSGWTGRMEAPRTVERKRNGRHADRIVLPTPPRKQEVSHLATPESVRRPAKPVDKVMDPATSAQPTMLPTPQTLPRQPRKAVVPPSSGADDHIMTPPSPTGHTTFYLSASHASGSRGEKISRRRPGLTFAQQMGLASASAGRPGVGVGMGGSRSGAHKKDQVVWGHLAEPVALGESEEENPFLVRPAQRVPKAPGRSTTHSPRKTVEDEDTTDVESLKYRRPRPAHADTGMLTPPPTRPERGVRTVPKAKVDPAEAARKREAKEQMKRMMDVESNPFLVKPGESSRPRQRLSPLADESKPTVTYVFRGAKKVFANPFYPTDAPFPQSLLDPEDEDYEPHPNPKPRLLWPLPPPRSKRISLQQEESEEEDMESPSGASPPSSPLATPRRRLFAKDTVQVVADQDEHEDEDEEDIDMSETPTRRRLFAPPSAPAKAKRPAEHAQEIGREEKRIKGMRV